MKLSRLLLSVFLGFCLMTGAMTCAYASSSGGGHNTETKEEKKSEAKSKKKEAASITGGQTPDEPIFLHMAPLTLPVINDYGAQQLVTMIIDLQMKDYETAEKIQKQMPRLKDAVLQALYGGLADGSMRNAHALDIVVIKKELLKTLERIFEPGNITDVLIQAVSQRKL